MEKRGSSEDVIALMEAQQAIMKQQLETQDEILNALAIISKQMYNLEISSGGVGTSD